jgi:hypothetical protein
MKERKYTVAGTASQYGITKTRFANDFVTRLKILDKAGCDNIKLVELPEPMSKLQALQYIKVLPEFQDEESAMAIDIKLDEKMAIAKRDAYKQINSKVKLAV